MTRTPLPADPRSGGFVLVGVVMFVLALTILGLSVFSLSSYEAQFLRSSRDEVQAFNDAMGGLDRAAYAIASTDSLESCRVLLPAGIDSTRAWVDVGGGQIRVNGSPGSANVWIKVAARRGGTVRNLIAQFEPQSEETHYKRTLHSASTVHVDPGGGNQHLGTMRLGDEVRQTDNDNTWLGLLASPLPSWSTAPVPRPEVASFITSKWSVAVQASYDAGLKRYTLDGPNHPLHTTGPDYFMWPHLPGRPNPDWTLFDTEGARIVVHGRVVWMVPHGLRIENLVSVVGDPGDCLVIVAGQGDAQADLFPLGFKSGIEFGGGLEAYIPVILVSDGTVAFSRINSPEGNANLRPQAEVPYFSGFARGFTLQGPNHTLGKQQWLLHGSSAAEDDPGGLIDRLLADDALPNAGSWSGARFEMIAGTWQDVTP